MKMPMQAQSSSEGTHGAWGEREKERRRQHQRGDLSCLVAFFLTLGCLYHIVGHSRFFVFVRRDSSFFSVCDRGSNRPPGCAPHLICVGHLPSQPGPPTPVFQSHCFTRPSVALELQHPLCLLATDASLLTGWRKPRPQTSAQDGFIYNKLSFTAMTPMTEKLMCCRSKN